MMAGKQLTYSMQKLHHCQSVTMYAFDKTNTMNKLEMWANAQRDGRPAEYRWRPLFNAAVWLTPTTRLPCNNAAKDTKHVEITWGAPN